MRIVLMLLLAFFAVVAVRGLSDFDGIASSGYACGYAEAVQWAAYGTVADSTTRVCSRYRQAAKDRGWFDDRDTKR